MGNLILILSWEKELYSKLHFLFKNILKKKGRKEIMKNDNYSILIVDDEEDFRKILSLYFEDNDYEVICAENGVEGLKLFQERKMDVLIFDIDMPGISGIDLLSRIHEESPDTPVIIISGVGNFGDVVNALRLGAYDYLTKPLKNIDVLGISVNRALEKVELLRENRLYRENLEYEIIKRTKDLESKKQELEKTNDELKKRIKEKKKIERELNHKNKFLVSVLSSISNPIFVVNVPDHTINMVNTEAKNKFNSESDEYFHQKFSMDHPCYQAIIETEQSKLPCSLETQFPDEKDAQKNRYYLISAYPIFDENEKITQVIEHIIDITPIKEAQEENKKLHEQFLQSQKMESVGRLAGGIAHDFNNMLTTIVGYGELILMDSNGEENYLEDLKTIIDTGRKAAQLTQQLLAFSRKQVMEWKIVNVNAILNDMKKMLLRLLGEDIKLQYELDDNIQKIQADPTQIDQVVLNLCVNARDAMPRGGSLNIKTQMVGKEHIQFGPDDELESDKYLMLTVTDNGEGIPNEIMEKIFEPFYTTKEKNKGTGLGLATVFGIVKQHKGFIQVHSELNQGTSFRIYFPVTKMEEKKTVQKTKISHLKGKGTILLVEDDENIRRLLKSYLSRLGFKILDTKDVYHALDINLSYEQPIHLMLTDVIMPEMDGVSLTKEILKTRKDIKVLLMSGYTDDRLNLEQHPELLSNFIRKPIDISDLVERISKLIVM